MSAKERLHQLIDEMNEDQATVLLMDLDAVPPPLSDSEHAAIHEAREALRAGKGVPLDEAIRRLRQAG